MPFRWTPSHLQAGESLHEESPSAPPRDGNSSYGGTCVRLDERLELLGGVQTHQRSQALAGRTEDIALHVYRLDGAVTLTMITRLADELRRLENGPADIGTAYRQP